MKSSDLVNVGLSEGGHNKLKWLIDERIFRELVDGYRFAVCLALAQRVSPKEITNRKNVFHVGTFDPDKTIKLAIETLMEDQLRGISEYRMAERLADWGVHELESLAKSGNLDFVYLFDQISKIKSTE